MHFTLEFRRILSARSPRAVSALPTKCRAYEQTLFLDRVSVLCRPYPEFNGIDKDQLHLDIRTTITVRSVQMVTGCVATTVATALGSVYAQSTTDLISPYLAFIIVWYHLI